MRPEVPFMSISSSPRTESSGKVAQILFLRSCSAARSAAVTGVPSVLIFRSRSASRNELRVSSPASRAISTANLTSSGSTEGLLVTRASLGEKSCFYCGFNYVLSVCELKSHDRQCDVRCSEPKCKLH